MKKNIWRQLAKKKPFFVLAPMAGVTDSPFRRVIAKIGGPDLSFTEFVSTEHIARLNVETQSFASLPEILQHSKNERPIIAQFFGCKPDQFRACAKLAVKLGFDGIDINMGCPDRKVLKQGSGSELINNPKLAKEIVRTVKEVVGGKMPISIKTRLGYDKKDIRNPLAGEAGWIWDILEEGVDAITIHGRTAKQGYSGEADWEEIGEITKEIKKRFPDMVVIGNGDVKSIEQGKMLAEKYGVDGVMIGREILHNPWIFNGGTSESESESHIRINPNINERLKIALEHTKLFEKHYGEDASVGAMKKYYKAYLAGVHGGLFDKKRLMDCKSIGEAKVILMSKS